jgi:hypothetical protein
MADRTPETKETPADDTPAKKPYAAPVLLHWGTFSELTQQNSHSSNKDRGGGPSRGTQ